MSWSDCLEIGRKSVQNGDFIIAKFWMEVALEKLPTVAGAQMAAANATEEMALAEGGSAEVKNARLEIMEALAMTEFNMGEYKLKVCEAIDERLSDFLCFFELKFDFHLTCVKANIQYTRTCVHMYLSVGPQYINTHLMS